MKDSVSSHVCQPWIYMDCMGDLRSREARDAERLLTRRRVGRACALRVKARAALPGCLLPPVALARRVLLIPQTPRRRTHKGLQPLRPRGRDVSRHTVEPLHRGVAAVPIGVATVPIGVATIAALGVATVAAIPIDVATVPVVSIPIPRGVATGALKLPVSPAPPGVATLPLVSLPPGVATLPFVALLLAQP